MALIAIILFLTKYLQNNKDKISHKKDNVELSKYSINPSKKNNLQSNMNSDKKSLQAAKNKMYAKHVSRNKIYLNKMRNENPVLLKRRFNGTKYKN